MLSRSRHTLDVSVETLMMIDSLLMTDEDRDRIVITHGTDTMPVTAKFLEGQVPGKTIVLTGAVIPYTFGSSDGFFSGPKSLSR
jgi:L-asparaginase